MKKVKLIITTMAIVLTTLSVSAKNTDTKEPVSGKTELRSQITSILGKKFDIKLKNNKEITADVSLLLNKKNELIVISVESKNEQVNAYVKSKLNYKKVNVRGIKKGEIYKMPLRIKKA